MRWRTLLAGIVVLVLTPAIAMAQRPRVRPEMTVAGLQRRNFSKDRQEIEQYFVRYQNQLPPGLAKRDALPPGLQDVLVRHGELPSGLEGEVQPLPRQLEVRLSALDVSLKRGYIDGKVITWNKKTRRVVDVIEL